MIVKPHSSIGLQPCTYPFYLRKPGPLDQVSAAQGGIAVNPAASGSGMLEFWKIGMLGLVDWDLFLL